MLMDKIGRLGYSWACNNLPTDNQYFQREKIKPIKINKITR